MKGIWRHRWYRGISTSYWSLSYSFSHLRAWGLSDIVINLILAWGLSDTIINLLLAWGLSDTFINHLLA
jgi:hypothetical protein